MPPLTMPRTRIWPMSAHRHAAAGLFPREVAVGRPEQVEVVAGPAAVMPVLAGEVGIARLVQVTVGREQDPRHSVARAVRQASLEHVREPDEALPREEQQI